MVHTGRQMKMALSIASLGYHPACWRLPSMPAGGTMQFQHYVNLLKTAERGKFDMIFLADVAASREIGPTNPNRSRVHHVVRHEPLTLLAALAPLTNNIGLVATASTTYNEPFNLARRLASIDHISGGRVGWNVVTGYNIEEAQNYGFDQVPDSATRYARVYEFLEITKGLWDSWEDDALIRDKESGIYLDPEKVHVLDYKGKQFRVRGPLDVARSPQGYPVFVTAGESDGARKLAAFAAEVLYAGLPNLKVAQGYYAHVKGLMPAHGRDPDSLKILAGIMAFVGHTKAEAQAKFDQLTALIHPEVGLRMILPMFGDLSHLPLDEPVSFDVIEAAKPDYNDFAKRDAITEHLIERIRLEKLTVRQIYGAIAEGYWQLGIIGTPAMIADCMEEWFTTGGCDGFIVQPPYIPLAVDDFVDLVIPELQRRGLFRTEYESATLRGNLGLARPLNQHVANRAG